MNISNRSFYSSDMKQDSLWNKFQTGMENLFLISFKIQSIISVPLGSYTVHAIIKRRKKKEKNLTMRLKKNGQLDARFFNLWLSLPLLRIPISSFHQESLATLLSGCCMLGATKINTGNMKAIFKS